MGVSSTPNGMKEELVEAVYEEGTGETAYLSSTEANWRHLLEAIEADTGFLPLLF